MKTSGPDPLATELNNELIPRRQDLFTQSSSRQKTVKINEGGIWNTVSIYQPKLVPSAKFAKRPVVYMPDEPIDERDDKIQKVKDRLQHKYWLTPRVNSRSMALCVLCTKAKKFDTMCAGVATHQQTIVELPEHIPEPFITLSWRGMEKTDVGRKDVDGHTPTAKGTYRSILWHDNSNTESLNTD